MSMIMVIIIMKHTLECIRQRFAERMQNTDSTHTTHSCTHIHTDDGDDDDDDSDDASDDDDNTDDDENDDDDEKI
eukprot:788925-Karenia_brevis.AAC.1